MDKQFQESLVKIYEIGSAKSKCDFVVFVLSGLMLAGNGVYFTRF